MVESSSIHHNMFVYRNSTGNFDFPAPNKCAPLVFNSLKLKRSCPSRPQRWVAVAPHSLPRSLRNSSRHLRPLAPKSFTRNTITILSSFDEHRAQARYQEKSNHAICLCNRNNKCRSHAIATQSQNLDGGKVRNLSNFSKVNPQVSQNFLPQQSQVGPTWTDGTQRKAQVGWQHLGFLCDVSSGACEGT